MKKKVRAKTCRESARSLLHDLHITDASSIDLETIAWHRGRLKVKYGGLTGAEGRIIATATDGGVIRVAESNNIGRTRFTIAHEIGHFELHLNSIIDRSDDARSLTIWNDPGEECEANIFAAELLMPEFLFKRPARSKPPSIDHISDLADTFETSLLATVFQYWEYTNEPLAVVISDGWEMTSFKAFRDESAWLKFGRIHEHSAAGERLSGVSGDSRGMVQTPAYAWLDGFDDDNEHYVMEDSIYLEYYDRTVSLIWIDEPLCDHQE